MPTLLHSPFVVQKPPAGAVIDWSHPLADRLVFATPFNEGSGRGVLDLVTGTLGIITQTATASGWRGGPKESGWALTAGGESMTWGDKSIWNPVIGFTASVLIRHNSTTDTALISKISGSPFNGWMMWRAGGNFYRIYVNGATRATGSTVVNPSTHRVTIVWDGATCYIYLDDRLDASGAYATAPSSSGQALTIGSYPGSSAGVGIYHDAFYWTRALRPYEIEWLNAEPYAMLRGPDTRRYYYSPHIPTTFTQTNTGALTSSGSIVRQVSKVLGGDL